jgi:hypothetical protein
MMDQQPCEWQLTVQHLVLGAFNVIEAVVLAVIARNQRRHNGSCDGAKGRRMSQRAIDHVDRRHARRRG